MNKDTTTPKSKKTVRVQLELPGQFMRRLMTLKDTIEATSYAEVVKKALKLYETLLDAQESGQKFYVKESDGSIKEYLIL